MSVACQYTDAGHMIRCNYLLTYLLKFNPLAFKCYL